MLVSCDVVPWLLLPEHTYTPVSRHVRLLMVWVSSAATTCSRTVLVLFLVKVTESGGGFPCAEQVNVRLSPFLSGSDFGDSWVMLTYGRSEEIYHKSQRLEIVVGYRVWCVKLQRKASLSPRTLQCSQHSWVLSVLHYQISWTNPTLPFSCRLCVCVCVGGGGWW